MRYLLGLLFFLGLLSCEKEDKYFELQRIINSNDQSIINEKHINKLIIKIDSIRQDSSRISLLNSLLTKSNRFNYNKLSFVIIRKLDQSSINKFDNLYCKFLINKALYFRNAEKLDSSFFYYNEAKKKSENIRSIKNIITSLYGMAELESKFNNYVTSEIKLKRILNLSITNNNYTYYYISCIALGNNYMSKGDYALSLLYHRKAHDYYIKNKEKIDVKFLHREAFLNNVGNVYKHLAKYEVAISLFNKALKNKNKIIRDDYELYGILMSNLGHCYLNSNKYHQAIKHFRIAESVFRKLNNYEELSLVLIQQSELFSKLKNKINSDLKGVNALKYSRMGKALKCELFILEKLIQLEINTKENVVNYISLRNKIDIAEDKSRNIFYKIQLETNQLVQAKEKVENQRNQVIWAICILLIISTLLFIIYRNRLMNSKIEFQKKHQKSSELIQDLILQNQAIEVEARQNEQRRIAMEIHDNVLNQLASVRYKLFKLNFSQDTKAVIDALQGVENIRQVEVELRNLTHNLTHQSQNDNVSIHQMIHQLITVHEEIYNQKIKLNIDDWNWEGLSSEVKLCFVRIIQEALFNCAKHAKAQNIEIDFNYTKDSLTVQIKDDGKGFNIDGNYSGIGLQNLAIRAAQIQAMLHIQSEKKQGTVIKIEKKII